MVFFVAKGSGLFYRKQNKIGEMWLTADWNDRGNILSGDLPETEKNNDNE